MLGQGSGAGVLLCLAGDILLLRDGLKPRNPPQGLSTQRHLR